jgi:hypothetical protein
MNYEQRDPYGMYKTSKSSKAGAGPDARKGPGPSLMGADTLVGNDVYNDESESLGDTISRRYFQASIAPRDWATSIPLSFSRRRNQAV